MGKYYSMEREELCVPLNSNSELRKDAVLEELESLWNVHAVFILIRRGVYKNIVSRLCLENDI